ncbi:hypothetical protein ACWDA7_35890 [Streptomyces sp. NPDC001156]
MTAVQEVRALAGRLQMADIGPQVALLPREDFVNNTEFKPAQVHTTEVYKLFAWSTALAPLRAASRAAA